jgi:glycine/D-amino acid oxidase-like deaminating enzyme
MGGMKTSYDVVIIGGGVTGSATAYFLAAEDAFDGSVLVVERDPTYQHAPSARATGGIRQQFSTPENGVSVPFRASSMRFMAWVTIAPAASADRNRSSTLSR